MKILIVDNYENNARTTLRRAMEIQKPISANVSVEQLVSPQFEHGEKAVLICAGFAYLGQVVERTQNNHSVYHKYFLLPLHTPMEIDRNNETENGKIYKLSG